MDRSTALHFFRGCAALLVVFHHLRNSLFADYKTIVDPSLWFKGLAFLAGFGPQAVIVFFVMSGWLVGGKFLKTPVNAPWRNAHYAVDRVTRLWTVLLVVFAYHALVHVLLGVSPGVHEGDFEISTLAGNLLGLQTMYVGYFGGNHPLWSLANETAYYVLFPLLLVVFGTRHAMRHRLVALLVTIAYAAILSRQILLYFAVWLVGVAACMFPYRKTRLLYVAVPLLALVGLYCRVNRIELNIFADLLLGSLFACCIWALAPSHRPNAQLRRLAVFLASFSFTLYVAHVPIIWTLEALTRYSKGVADPSRPGGALWFAAFYVATVAIAYVLYLAGEAHTQRVRDKVKVLLGIRTGRAFE